MRFALIENDIVINVVEAESAESLAVIFPKATILQHDRAGTGWRLDGKALVEPKPEPPPLWEELPITEYLALFTPKEWRGYKRAADEDEVIDHLLLILSSSATVHRRHPLVQLGLERGVALGILTPARRAEIGG